MELAQMESTLPLNVTAHLYNEFDQEFELNLSIGEFDIELVVEQDSFIFSLEDQDSTNPFFSCMDCGAISMLGDEDGLSSIFDGGELWSSFESRGSSTTEPLFMCGVCDEHLFGLVDTFELLDQRNDDSQVNLDFLGTDACLESIFNFGEKAIHIDILVINNPTINVISNGQSGGYTSFIVTER